MLHSRPGNHIFFILARYYFSVLVFVSSSLTLMLFNFLLVTDGTNRFPAKDLWLVYPLLFEVFPPVRQPRGAQLRGAGRQPLLHEVDGRSRPGRLTRAALGPGHSGSPQPGGSGSDFCRTERIRTGGTSPFRLCPRSESSSFNPLM